MKISSSVLFVLLMIVMSFWNVSYAGNEGDSPDDVLPFEAWQEIFRNLPRVDTVIPGQVCSDFNVLIKRHRKLLFYKARSEILKNWAGFDEFDQFSKIPTVKLPNIQDEIVPEHKASKFLVTRQTWGDIIGESSLSEDLKLALKLCPHCPVTNISHEEIQYFLDEVNRRTAALGCTYDLPTDAQLWASIRADSDGTNQDPYSKGVTAQNVNEYVTYMANSYGQMQPVGSKRLNGFGIELGNALKLSKNNTVRGGAWNSPAYQAQSNFKNDLSITGLTRHPTIGFTLVKTCPHNE
jgi:hypothetical protein